MEHSKGMTLAEVVVGMFLLLLLTGLIVALLVPSLRAQVSGSQQVELQQQAAVMVEAMVADLRASAPRAVSLRNLNPAAPAVEYPVGYTENNPLMLAVIRTTGVLPDGQVTWQDRPVLYVFRRDRRELVRRSWKNPPSLSVALTELSPARLTDADLLSLASSPTAVERRLGDQVEFVDVSHDLGRGYPVGELFTITVVTARRERCTLTRQVDLRN